ncbi:hypothetical protein WR25_17892 [Diploscapter pachys]|uniref:UBA domain-containing protein n=1 Tax=Diploscapter pachys TaxID=2018661 RepID=A0A2A2KTJ7_9BILA|nr:hypothetical protein WR25_17892 [Diploscapter pachys]
MVKIYCGEQCTNIEAVKLRAMTAKEAVAAASKLGDKSAILTRCGRVLAPDTLLQDIGDNDILRIVHREIVSDGVNQEDVLNFDKNFTDVHRHIKRINDEPNDDGISLAIFLQKIHDFINSDKGKAKIQEKFGEGLRKDATAMAVLQDAALLSAFFISDTPEIRQFHREHPLISKLTKEIASMVDTEGRAPWQRELMQNANNPQLQMDLLQQLMGTAGNNWAPNQRQGQGGQASQNQAAGQVQAQAGGQRGVRGQAPAAQQNIITPQMLINALASVGAGPSASSNVSPSSSNVNTAVPSTPPTSGNSAAATTTTPTSSGTTPRQEKDPRMIVYSTQLKQLHEFGFTDDDINLSVLDATSGDVNATLNILAEMLGQ